MYDINFFTGTTVFSKVKKKFKPDKCYKFQCNFIYNYIQINKDTDFETNSPK